MIRCNYYNYSYFLFFYLASILPFSLSILSFLNQPSKFHEWYVIPFFSCRIILWKMCDSVQQWKQWLWKMFKTKTCVLTNFLIEIYCQWIPWIYNHELTMRCWCCKSSVGFCSFILNLNLNLFTNVTYSYSLNVPNLSKQPIYQQWIYHYVPSCFSGDICMTATIPHRNAIRCSMMFNTRDVKTSNLLLLNYFKFYSIFYTHHWIFT